MTDTTSPVALNNLAEVMLSQGWAQLADGQLRLLQHDAPIEQIVRELAVRGYFPTTAWFRRYVKEGLDATAPDLWFEARDYRIRAPVLADLPALLRLEEECWIEPLRATSVELQQRIADNAQGQFVLEIQGQVVGVIYSQRIPDADALLHTNFRDVAALHRPDAPLVQPLAVNVLPSMQQYGLGDQLLEFLLQVATLQPDVERAVAVTLCKEYHRHQDMPMEAYIHLRNEHGQPVDPILSFHAAHGAQIRRTIDGYRPADLENQGKGVLVEYDLRNRFAARPEVDKVQRTASIATIVEDAVRAVMGERHTVDFSRRLPLMEMGVKSIELLELRYRLSQGLGVEVEPTFFFRYNTVDAMIDYFQHGEQAPASTAPQPGAHDVTLDRWLEPHTARTEHVTATHDAQVNEPIAIVGMACRLPGGVTTPAAFWSLLANGVDAISEVPPSRWDIDAYYGDQPGQIVTRYGGFVDDVDCFDAPFFRISPVEAVAMDPQQRLLLETHWEALEDAGIRPDSLHGSATGIFVGIYTDDYKLLQAKRAENLSTYFGTGTANSVAAGRIAYFLGLHGPTLAVDTACSSSLVAVHLACQSLQQGDCTLALASGANLLLSPELSITFSQANMLAPDGRCKTFDASANGYVRSEGCGVVVLKRLSDALADGDTVLAVIRASAINQDGASNGLTAPNERAQEEVHRKALTAAGLAPQQISYVEAHGTGTPLGDPIEIRALEAVYGPGRTADNPLIVGSVKTNIGHTEAAAGIAGLMKVVLSLQHRYIPPHLHFRSINPLLSGSPVKIPTQGLAWTTGEAGQPRRAAVSSFGFSGTNAHVILEEAPSVQQSQQRLWRPYHLLTLSGKNKEALKSQALNYHDFLGNHPTLDLADICFTAHSGRTHFEHRLSAIAESPAQMRTALHAYVSEDELAGISRGSLNEAKETVKVAFLFTGQGSQYPGMGRELYNTQRTFRIIIDRCDRAFQEHYGRSLIELLYPMQAVADTDGDASGDLITSHPCAQAANFAIECALAELWRAWGVKPGLVLGHSLGDFAAAYTAGVIGLEDGIRLVTTRGRLMEHAAGAMVAVMASAETVTPFVAPFRDAAIGVINGPQSVVISGARSSVESITTQLKAAGFKTRQLAIPVAAHSPLLDPVLDAFEAAVRNVQLSAPTLPVVSSMTGTLVDQELTDPGYWRKHLRNTVRFADGAISLREQGGNVFIEIGPKPTLLSLAEESLERMAPASAVPSPLFLPSLRQGQSDWQQMLASLGKLYVRGVEIDWATYDRDYQRCKVTLPTYPFQRQRYWLETPKKKRDATALRPLIERMVKSPTLQATLFESEFSLEALPYLSEHQVYGEVVSPSAVQIAMALDAAQMSMGKNRSLGLDDVILPQALVLPRGQARTVQTVFHTAQHNGNSPKQEFRVVSFPARHDSDTHHESNDATIEVATHATGYAAATTNLQSVPADLIALQARCRQTVDIADFYAKYAEAQIELGPWFHWLAAAWQCSDGAPPETLARLVRPEPIKSLQGYALHPGLIDACFQVATLAMEPGSDTMLPFALDSLRVERPAQGEAWWCHTVQTGNNKSDIQLLSVQGELVATIKGFQVRAVPASAIRGTDIWHDWLYTVDWQPRALYNLAPTAREAQTGNPGVPRSGRTWLILADERGIGATLATQLRQQGDSAVLVYRGDAWQQVDDTTVYLAPYHAGDYRRLVSALPRLHGVVHLWSLGAQMDGVDDVDPVQDARLGCDSALLLVQALLHEQVGPAGLWLVTQDAQAATIEDQVTGAAQAPLWGMGKVIGLEHPELKPVCIDLDNRVDCAILAAQLLAEMTSTSGREMREQQVALRPDARYVARLQHFTPQPAINFSCRPDATYLITGGLGGLGLATAARLAQQGAKHLLLMGRSKPKADIQPQLDALAASGAAVTVVQGDISNQQRLQAILDQIDPAYPLRGVIHCVGVLDDGALTQQNWERFAKVLAPKMQGAWNLHTLTKDMTLDFFVLFSSTASLLGNRGQANHAAANAFLDAFAYHRRAQGLPALSINWGPWAEIGTAAEMVRTQQMVTQGRGAIAPLQGIAAFAYLLRQPVTQVGVAPIRWPDFLTSDAQANAFYAEFMESANSVTASDQSPAVSLLSIDVRRQLSAALPEQRTPLLVEYLHETIAKVLGIRDPRQIDPHETLMKMGLDSLMAIEVRNRITQTLALTIPLSSFFDEGCIASLASTIAGQVGHMVEGSIPASIRSTYIPEKTGTPPELRQAQPVQRNAGVNAPTEDVEGEL